MRRLPEQRHRPLVLGSGVGGGVAEAVARRGVGARSGHPGTIHGPGGGVQGQKVAVPGLAVQHLVSRHQHKAAKRVTSVGGRQRHYSIVNVEMNV